jgi:hypothetical protein
MATKINETENRVKQKEQSIGQKEGSLEKQIKENEVIKENLNRQIELVNFKRTELEKHQEEHIRRLEKIAGLTGEEAKAQLIESLKQEAQTQALALQQEIIDDARQKANKELSFKLIRKNLRIQNPEVVEAAYEDGVTLSYPYFTERQFKIAVELLEKSLEQSVQLTHKQVVDHSLVDEINRPGANRPQ